MGFGVQMWSESELRQKCYVPFIQGITISYLFNLISFEALHWALCKQEYIQDISIQIESFRLEHHNDTIYSTPHFRFPGIAVWSV